jgi:hypothetical protein
MPRFAAALIVCASLAAVSPAQDPKLEPPAPPAGWKAVVSKDGTYRFAVPPGTGRSGTRDHSFSINRIRVRSLVNYYTLKDGTTLEVEAATLTGAGLSGLKVGDVFDAIVDGQKEEGFKASDPKDVKVGQLKAKEYRLTKDKTSRRMVIFSVKPRVFILTVDAEDPALLDTETVNTFVNALVLVPAEVVKAQAKERAAKDEAAGKENLEKFGFKWTTALKDMTPPDAPVVGVVRGREFKPDSVKLDAGNWLIFRQGDKGTFADIEVKIWLFPKAGESVENKTYEIPTSGAKGGASTPHIQMATMTAGRRIPQSESFLNRYALKLTLAAKDADGNIPGTIYLCTPDSGKSFLAGTFTAKGK